MQKNEFGQTESYEYMSNNNGEVEADQFFVVQDDGTLLMNRQVQYIAQMQHVREGTENLQGCTVYDVNPQQFFVDVTDNTTELVSVADNYIFPSVSKDNEIVYNNSFLMQAVTNENEDQIGRDLQMNIQFKENSLEEAGVLKRQGSCTEITLTDDQYKTLEQKGWVLLEGNGKKYLLDTVGLHDITSNHDLIKTLTDESRTHTDDSISLAQNAEHDIGLKHETTIETDDQIHTVNECSALSQDIKQLSPEAPCIEEEYESNFEGSAENVNDKSEEIKPSGIQNVHESSGRIKIVTKYTFKEIPDKIVLGKTANGKRLVARVVKQWTDPCDPEKNKSNKGRPEDNKQTSNNEENDYQCKKLFQEALCGLIGCNSEEVMAASKVIAQLSQIPDVKSSIDGRNVIVTKVVERSVAGVKVESSSFVTGFITSVQGCPSFVHKPDLLQQLIRESEESPNRSLLKCQQSPSDHKILQIHVTETKTGDVEAISVFLNSRDLPSKAVGRQHSSKPNGCSRFFACGACAAIYASREDLDEHQDVVHASEAEGALTIDTDQLPAEKDVVNKNYNTVSTDKGTMFECYKCPQKFSKLANCIRHTKVHMPRTDERDQTELSKDPPHKCPMCSSAYFHSASLSKHICRVHVTDKYNKQRKIMGLSS